MTRKFLLTTLIVLLTTLYCPKYLWAAEVEVSGDTGNGEYVYGELDVDSSGNVDGYVYTDNGKEIHVEGSIEDRSTVEIYSDDSDGGGYELDIDSWN